MLTNSSVGYSASVGVLQNETSSHPEWNSHVLPVFIAIKVSIGVTGLVGNFFVVLVMYKYRKLFVNMKTAYVINQSVLDAAASAVLILSSLIRSNLLPLMDGVAAELFCRLWLTQILVWGLITSSTYNLMAISIERYIIIAHPFWHRTSFSDTKIRTSVVAIWLLGFIFITSFVVPTTRLVQSMCFPSYFWPSRKVAIAVGCLTTFVQIVMPIAVHCLCYIRILTTLRVRVSPAEQPRLSAVAVSPLPSVSGALAAPSQSGGSRSVQWRYLHKVGCTNTKTKQHRDSSNMKATKNVTKSFAIVTACFFVCWIPNKVYVFLYMLGAVSYFGDVYQYTVILVFLNCCINPFIYAAKHDAFKKGLAKLFRCG